MLTVEVQAKKKDMRLSPHILVALPSRYRSALPIAPHWSARDDGKWSTFYFGAGLLDDAEFDMVTYKGGDAIMRSLSVKLHKMFEKHRSAYFDHIRGWMKIHPTETADFSHWPSFEDWIGRHAQGEESEDGVPTGETFRHHAEESHYRVGGAGKTSRHMWRTREMQQVPVSGCASFDHTYDTAKNFANEKGKPPIKMVWDGATGEYGEPITAVCTRGTDMDEVIVWDHMRNMAKALLTPWITTVPSSKSGGNTSSDTRSHVLSR